MKVVSKKKRTGLFLVSILCFALLALCLPAPAHAASTKTIEVPGIGDVTYVSGLSEGDFHAGAGEWYHYSISGKDARQMSDRSGVAYLVEDYPALPERTVKDELVEQATSEDGTGGLPEKLYGTAKLTFYEFWESEGLTAGLSEQASGVKDPEGYYDLGAFDAVTRATLSYGIGHAAFTFGIDIRGYKSMAAGTDDGGTPEDTSDDTTIYDFVTDANGDPIPVGSFTPTFRATSFASSGYGTVGIPTYAKGEDTSKSPSGHASAEMFYTDATDDSVDNPELYWVDSYDVTGPADMPVSVGAMDYVEMMIKKDLRLEIPGAFKNVTVGGALQNLYDESDPTGATVKTVPVDATTGLLKHLGRDGTYGPMAAGRSEYSYTIVSNGGVDSYGTDYDSSWGDYFDVFLYFQKGGSTGEGQEVGKTGQVNEYFAYVNNFLGAKYEYYGTEQDLGGAITDLAGLAATGKSPKAVYGTKFAADAWQAPNKKPRLELGFNFDSLRLGGDGTSTTSGGIYQYGSSRDKTGYYKVTLYALGHENIEKLVYVPDRSFTLSQATLSLKPADSATLTANAKLQADVSAFTWASSDEAVATVDENGTVTAVKDGTATVTATAKIGNKTYTADSAVTVATPTSGGPTGDPSEGPTGDPSGVPEDPAPLAPAAPAYEVKTVRAAQKTYTISKNGKLTIPYELDMASGDADDVKLTWESSDPAKATVDPATGKITGKKNGTVTITVKDEAGNTVGTFKIKVVAKAVKVTKLTAKAKKATLAKKGATTTIAVTVSPKNATDVVAKFSLDSKSKKIVSVDKAGKVTAKKKGTATVTVKAGGKTAKVKITVKK